MPTFYMLIGLPGSGKSTWRGKHIAANASTPTRVISSDDIIEEWAAANNMNYSEAWSKISQKDVAAKFKANLKDALASGEDVIVDRTNMSPKARKEILKHVPETYEKVAVTFVIPDTELKTRLKARAIATGKTIPDFVVNNMAKAYVPPTKEEFARIVRINS